MMNPNNQQTVDLSLLTLEEWQKIRDWNTTQVEYEQHQSIHQLVEIQVQQTPDQVAVDFEEQQLTYQELNQRANQLAGYLHSLGVGPDVLVGICMERSPEMIIALLAILKAGGAYLPLDTAYPAERLRFMLEDSRAPILLTQNHLFREFTDLNVQVIDLNTAFEAVGTASSSNLNLELNPERLAYMIYTSGSTGKPKGVAMPHRSLVNLLRWQQQDFQFSQAKTLQFTPIGFDVSFQEIFSTLISGGTLVLIADEVRRNAERLLQYISVQAIERLFLPFVALQHLAEVATTQTHLPVYLREVITAGEQLKVTRSIAHWFEGLKDCTLYNQYGPSESHVVTSYRLSGSPKTWPHLPPIGCPIANAKIYLLDPNRRRKGDPIRLVPIGEPGEIAIGGVALASGYCNHPDLEDEKFIPDPFSVASGLRLYRTGDLARYRADGSLEYIERIDSQIKIRGVRIELGEIEANLSQHPNIKDVAVVAREDSQGIKYLVTYYVSKDAMSSQASDRFAKELYVFLKAKLPKCMIPSTFMAMDKFPLTPSGKVDRRALPEPRRNRAILELEFVAPRTPLEEQLSEIWAQVLSIEAIGIHDNFWDLGGDSLRAIQLVSKLRDACQQELPMAAIFDAPTIAQLAELVESASLVTAHSTIDPWTVAELEVDTVLDLTIDASPSFHGMEIPGENILITGVTGYLGAFLLQELLKETQASIYCLVRAKTAEAAKQEIEENLKKYLLWHEDYEPRICPISGDLAQPMLGLPEQQFLALCKTIDAVYHNAAQISLIHPYSSLRAANVLGTHELLRLSSSGKLKPFHFISTLDVFQTSGAFGSNLIAENDDLNIYEAIYFDGYTKSKWASEKLVRNAQLQGLPTCIYRPAMIAGHSQTGASNTNDLMNRLIKGFIQLRSAPEFDMMINIAPIDYFSQGVIHLSRKNNSLGKAFNFVNPQPMSMSQFIELMNDCGYPVEKVCHEIWETLLTQNASTLDSIVTFLTSKPTAQSVSYLERSSVGAYRVDRQNVAEGLEGTSIFCPAISDNLLKTYFSYFSRVGFLDAPITASGLVSSK